MKHNRYFAAALAVFVAALALSGCKSHEKIDLSGIHTTAAETMAPAGETMPNQNPKETTAAETAAKTTAAESGAASETKKGQNASAALSTRSKLTTYKDGKVSIEYPVLSNLREEKLEESVNALIKEKATQVLKNFTVNPQTDTVSVKCNVVSLDRNKAVLTYEGSLMTEGAAYPQGVFYTTTVDLNKGTLIGLADYADSYTMAGYIVSADCKLASGDNSAEVMEFIKSRTLDEYWELLKDCDFKADSSDSFPKTFSYENQGIVYMAVPTDHAVGDYAIIRFSPDTK